MNTYLRKILMTTALSVGLASVVLAQTPQQINYQTVVRNSSGELITGQSVGIELSILQGSASGNAVYTETHTITTNDFGMVNLKLGGGTSNDDMMNIDWSGDSYFLAVGLDINGGSSYTAMGTSELVSVPYALMAYRSENDSVNDADADPNNELISSAQLNGNDLEITDAGGTTTVDMTALLEDDDADPANEIQTLSLLGDQLSLTSGGSVTFPYDSSYWQIDADTIYTMDEHVAIGANSANARLYVYTDGSSTNSSIEAVAEAPGFNRAIIGRVYSKDANTVNQFGVVGIAQVAPGESTGGSNWHYGVDGESYINNTASSNVGLNGNADGLGVNNYGVRGNSGDSANVRNYGGYFSTSGQDDNFNIGVLSIADGSHIGTNYAFYGIASNAGINYAGFFAGDVNVTGTFTNPSDRMLKTDIEPYSGALKTVKQIGTFNYQYKVGEYDHMHLPKGPQIGFIAQDLEKVLPNLISEQKAPSNAATDSAISDVSPENAFTTFKGVNYIGMIPVLTQAINEQQTLIEEQSELIKILTARIEALEN